ncbi:hypothetical protein lerEdw1_017516 [Lerista edwardsae]|nr:hypothetical protein lerEdw1_017516 [Lerista edwardsae]
METVEVFNSEAKGRGLKAAKEFWAGDVVFAERAYAAVVFDSLTHVVCHTCFKRHERLHRCGQCKFAQYCDRTCQKDAWVNHKSECSAIKKHGKAPTETIRLAARILWRIEREGGGLTEGCLVSIDNLQNHVEHLGEEEKKELRIDVESFLEFWPTESKQFGMQYISHILGVELVLPVGFASGEELNKHTPIILSYILQPSQEAVKDIIQFTKETLEKIDKARSEGIYHEVVKLSRECVAKQEVVLGETNIYLLRILSIISEVLSYLQLFDEAAGYSKRMVDGYLKLYHPNNAQLGMALMRAGVTHWHAGLIEAGHGMICKAYAILLVTHGPSHPITKDLEGMRVQSEMELRMFQQNEFLYYKMREAALQNQKIQIMPEPTNEISPGIFQKKQ